jgi:phosphinothricin acetyltransferase
VTDTIASAVVRTAAEADAEAIAAIHNAGIAERQATFETTELTPDDAVGWIGRDREPLLVAELDGRVAGFARVMRSSDRCATAGVGEYTIYLAASSRGRGIGARLLDALVAAAEQAGYWKLIGKIFTTNTAGVALAARVGFREVGVYERHGRLDGEWKDLLVVERLLDDPQAEGS